VPVVSSANFALRADIVNVQTARMLARVNGTGGRSRTR
jgi:hypothetical protein